MPRRRNNRQLRRQLIAGLGLGGNYAALIAKAVREDWGETEFLTQLTRTRTFKRTFPGIINNGRLEGFLTDGDPTISLGNLRNAIGSWRKLQESYNQIAKAQGSNKVDRREMAFLIRGDISPEEYGRRSLAVRQFKDNPEALDAYNDVRREIGLPPLDDPTKLKFLAGAASHQFYDVYEAALLRSANLGFSTQQSVELARDLGVPGQTFDIGALVRDVKAKRSDIGPELAAAGISDAALTRFLADPGTDPDNIAGTLNTLVANRRARSKPVVGTYARQGSGGGPATYAQENAGVD